MEKNTNNPQANRILYIVIVAVLCIAALVVGITAALQRNKDPNASKPSVTTTTPAATTTTAPPTTTVPPEATLPTFVSPAVGTVAKEHDLSVLVYSNTMGDWRVHSGIDIATEAGAEVYASADGTVSQIYYDPFMGHCMELSHNGGAVSVYKNLTETHAEGIAVGSKVMSGDLLSYVGDSAAAESADEPHLHFEMKVNGSAVDPLTYLKDESLLVGGNAAYEG